MNFLQERVLKVVSTILKSILWVYALTFCFQRGPIYSKNNYLFFIIFTRTFNKKCKGVSNKKHGNKIFEYEFTNFMFQFYVTMFVLFSEKGKSGKVVN